MTTRDQAVGHAVTALRRGHSQQAVAEAMREKGLRWSQATVWAVEKGERPLRLIEADVLADVLGCRVVDFLGGELHVELKQAAEEFNSAAETIRTGTVRLLAAREKGQTVWREAGERGVDLAGVAETPFDWPDPEESVDQGRGAHQRGASTDYEAFLAWSALESRKDTTMSGAETRHKAVHDDTLRALEHD